MLAEDARLKTRVVPVHHYNQGIRHWSLSNVNLVVRIFYDDDGWPRTNFLMDLIPTSLVEISITRVLATEPNERGGCASYVVLASTAPIDDVTAMQGLAITFQSWTKDGDTGILLIHKEPTPAATLTVHLVVRVEQNADGTCRGHLRMHEENVSEYKRHVIL